jgi:hypothetical protein
VGGGEVQVDGGGQHWEKVVVVVASLLGWEVSVMVVTTSEVEVVEAMVVVVKMVEMKVREGLGEGEGLMVLGVAAVLELLLEVVR